MAMGQKLVRVFVLVVVVLQVSVLADYELSVQVHSYRNPSHRHAGGGCCDRSPYCYNECDNYFVFCLSDGLETDYSYCPLGEKHTGEIDGGDSLQFRDTVGDLANPVQFDVQGRWTGPLYLFIDVYDRDDYFPIIDINSDEFVDTIEVYLSTISSTTTQTAYKGIYKRGTIVLSFQVSCAPYYYGEDCGTFCQPTEGVYCCGNEGERVCEDHYYGPDCSVFCDPPTERHRCDDNGEITCVDSYYGSNCTVFCEPVEKRFNCSDEGERVCLESYYREQCDVFCVGRDDESGHYSCDPEGERVCLVGYREPETNCTKRSCSPPCSLGGGYCDESGICQCFSGWMGESCDTTVQDSGSTPLNTGGIDGKTSSVNVGAIVGGVIGGLAVLILSILVAIMVLCIWQCRGHKSYYGIGTEQLLQEEERSNVIVGENPNYLQSAVGTHTNDSDSERGSFSFANPLYTRSGSPHSYVSIDNGRGDSSRPTDGVYSTIDHREMREPPYLPGSVSSGSGSYDYVPARRGELAHGRPSAGEASEGAVANERRQLVVDNGTQLCDEEEVENERFCEASYTFLTDTL